MNLGIVSVKDLIELLSYVVTIVSLIALYIAYKQSTKQIHFSVMTKCIQDYRNFLKSEELDESRHAMEYIELINEELFYLEKNYLPFEVAVEWIDGMIDYLPFYANGRFQASKNLSALNSEEKTRSILYDYPRIKKIIALNTEINLEIAFLDSFNEGLRLQRQAERKKIIVHILMTLKKKRTSQKALKKKVEKFY